MDTITVGYGSRRRPDDVLAFTSEAEQRMGQAAARKGFPRPLGDIRLTVQPDRLLASRSFARALLDA